MGEAFKQYCIYERPADYPDGFIVREWTIADGEATPGAGQIAATLAIARSLVPATYDYRMARSPQDDPCIVETWI